MDATATAWRRSRKQRIVAWVTTDYSYVTSADQLTELVGNPIKRVAEKVRTTLADVDKQWLAHSPFCLVATTDAAGRVDVSPKGDPAGLAYVLDERTLVIPDRPGNRRVDGFHNVLQNPHVGLIFLIPGRGDTLRVNGTAQLLSDAPLVHAEEVFYHCSKAFLRSGLWEPSTWNPDAMASRAHIAHAVERNDETIEAVELYYSNPNYGRQLY
jgi:PPOX class probable FMN-dependent enzyme